MSRRPARAVHAQPTGDTSAQSSDKGSQVFTIPNLISFGRLLGVPIFLYLFLVAHADIAAIVVLAIGGTSDWIDGYIARRLRQVSRLGELLDPLADRLYILATLVAFTAREVVPWQFTAALLARELLLGLSLLVLRRYGYGPPPVHYVGKTATFILLAAFPVLLLASTVSGAATAAGAIGWGLAWWGLVLYWVAGVLYVIQAVGLVRAAREYRTGAA
ncbi:CDP-alcohol phosphatidyltransferase family protein [Micromonospora sp. NPDC003197]